MALLGLVLVWGSFFYFILFFEIDYGISVDEWIGLLAFVVGINLIAIAWLRRDMERRVDRRVEAWKRGEP